MTDKKNPSKSPRDTGGPVVKTGPNAGQNRARRKDGGWWAKRSDAGKSRKSKCFITTVACHHKGLADDCHELETLRRFRDDYLLTTREGCAMVDHYYFIAPAIAERLVRRSDLVQVWDVVKRCVCAIEAKRYEDATSMYMAMVLSLEKRLLDRVA